MATGTERHKSADKLINEAIKRILLDVLVRGHGDRLIGKWSREPELQEFLDQVPYMLDRINQLHLACTRGEAIELDHVHHYHHHHHHGRRCGDQRDEEGRPVPLAQSSLHDFVNLIGSDNHWLVRTRDPLGLTPLHKAVLFNNRPVVEYILDRYADELVAGGGIVAPSERLASRSDEERAASRKMPVNRLIDAQDKYGRTALHYAAAALCRSSPPQLYRFLLAKGASTKTLDFRGKSPAYYLGCPNQLRSRSIVHLANKLNANYQASVLSKSLRATLDRRPLDLGRDENEDSYASGDDADSATDHDRCSVSMSTIEHEADGGSALRLTNNRESMSMSCGDLSTLDASGRPEVARGTEGLAAGSQTKSDEVDSLLSEEDPECVQPTALLVKQLKAERIPRQIVDAKTKQHIKRCLNDGNLEKISGVLVDGHGEYLMSEAPVSCWNSHCRSYIGKVVPRLLSQLDRVHEFIASNQVGPLVQALGKDPILARIKRPYKRASLGAIHMAVLYNRKSILRHLIGKFPELVVQQDSTGATCLHWAARSLKSDSIYCWLSDNFGPQLEQIRDSRNRTAADNRQQVIRCTSYELGNLSTPLDLKPTSARKFIRTAQMESNELRLDGERSNLHKRTEHRANMRVEKSTSEKKVSVSTFDSSNLVDDDLKTSVEIGIDSASSSRSMDLLSEANAEKAASLDKISMDDGIAAEQSYSDPAVVPDADCLTEQIEQVGAPQEQLAEPEDIDVSNREMLSELAQLEAVDSERPESGSTVSQPIDRPPSSASSAKRLNSLIFEWIRYENFKKLEHLVLAGCGLRIVEVYTRRVKGTKGDKWNLSEKLTQFIGHEIPTMMQNIAHVHESLHQAYVHPYQPESSDAINANFHKLCNLLIDSKSLIMGRDEFGASPLHVAVLRCDNRLIDYLLRRHPDAASGPDHESRNAVHYAAITLAAIEFHSCGQNPSSLKLTRTNNSSGDLQLPLGYWDINVRDAMDTFEKLSARYGDLLGNKDKHGLTCDDYRRGVGLKDVEHLDISQQPVGMLPGETLASCCKEYAKWLSRYNYLIINDERQNERVKIDRGEDINSLSEPTSSSQGALRPSKRAMSCDDGTGSSYGEREINVLGGELVIPATGLPLGTAQIKQEDSKNVGVSKDSGHISAISTNEIVPVGDVGRHSATSRSAPAGRDQSFNSADKHQAHRLNLKSASLLGDVSGPSGSFVLGPEKPEGRGIYNQHGHHSHRLKSPSSSAVSRSFVGGVIVPTIIHNDKMDEIETYDIIYRQPPQTSAKSVTSDKGSPIDQMVGVRSKRTELLGGQLLPSSVGQKSGAGSAVDDFRLRNNSSSSSEDIDSGSDDIDDERVERLSNEFEDRVRREKSELRTKVDQIMNEIKANAKSSKSSRFLVSPIDGNSRANDDNSTTAMLLTNSNTLTDSQRYNSIGSSSGRSSATSGTSSSVASSKSSSSSLSTNNGRRLNAGSDGSCNSSCSSSVSSASSASSLRAKSGINPLDSAAQRQLSQPQLVSRIGIRAEQTAKTLATTVSDLANQMVSKNTYGQTYLHFIASRSQCPATLYKVLDHGSHMIGERDVFYRTARDVAVQFNLPNNVQIFDKFIIDQFIEGNTSLLRHLLNHGYSPLIHVSDPDGNDIMLILKLLKLDRMIHFLLQMADFQRWRDELHTFIRHGYSAGVSELIKKHKDLIKAKSVHSRTSLHLAVLFDRLEMVSELIEADRSSVNCSDNMGRSALHYTYGLHLKNAEAIRDKLLAFGANLDARDVKMRTPKYYYIFKREIEEIKRIELELN